MRVEIVSDASRLDPTHSKESGANLGESRRDVTSIVSFLSLILAANSVLGISTLVLVRLDKRVETNISLAGQLI